MKKTLLKLNQLITPIYLYLVLLLAYFLTISYVSSKLWSDVMLYSITLGLPVVFAIWLNMRLRRIQKNKLRYLHTFLISFLPGFFPGALVGYAFWTFGHGNTVLGFLSHVLSFGIPTGAIFGLVGLLANFISKKIGH